MSDFLYVPDVARRLGITEGALRQRIQRQQWDRVPRPRRRGRRIVWTVEDYESWRDSLPRTGEPTERSKAASSKAARSGH